MTTHARESPSNSTSRNKENDPFQIKGPRQQFIPSLAKSPDKNEFFTDTILDNSDASQHSLIPLPKSSKDNPAQPRKKIRTINSSRNSKLPQKHRATRSELSSLPAPGSKNPFSRNFARDSSPLRSTGLSTPPRSRDGSSIASPFDTFSSPPRALTETYERIDQEEDLAATEGEISDPDDYDVEEKENEPKVNGLRVRKQPSLESTGRLPRSRGSTPTDRVSLHRTPRVKDMDLTAASVLSDPTGMSFVRELSNQNLQLALTPLVLESARDRKALEQAWTYRKPVAFSKAGRVAVDNIDLLDHSPPQEHLPPRRLIPFSKAGKIKLASDLRTESHHYRTLSDSTQKHNRSGQTDHDLNRSDKWQRNASLREPVRHNPRLHRENYFTQNHGFPARNVSTMTGDDFMNGGTVHSNNQEGELPLGPPSVQPYELEPETQQHPGDENREQSETEIDWLHLAVDEPMKTIETAPSVMTDDNASDTRNSLDSPEKSRKLDIDFTGQSFQVSESPPLRAKNTAKDYFRTREIEGLERQAVTTNRLTQLRARESLEQLRATSRSPILEKSETDRLLERPWRSNSLNGEKLPKSPVLNFRASLPNGIGKQSSTANERPSPSRSCSHDVLQRLARGSSSTPRSSTPSERMSNTEVPITGGMKENGNNDQINSMNAEHIPLESRYETQPELESEARFERGLKSVQQTPRVTGAWLDTVLPDTIKPPVRHDHGSKYIQTPHVSTGAWIDTPAPHVQSTKLDPVMEILQEVPEELMNGIVRDKPVAVHDNEVVTSASEVSKEEDLRNVAPVVEESLAKKVLTEAKEKTRSKGYDLGENTDHSMADDTLALGSATVQSLENFLDMDETDMTILSRINEDSLGPTETEVIFRLVSKLDRLRGHLNDAKKGLSHLEHQISQPQQMIQDLPPTPIQIEGQTECSKCAITKHLHAEVETSIEPVQSEIHSKSMLPFTLLSLAVPVPVLFRRTRTTSTGFRSRLPEPTPLGWLVMALWTWYVLECTFCEIYSRPQYASRYSWPVLQEPEFPYVLPTMLYRWSRLNFLWPSVVQPFLGVFVGIFRFIGIWLGLTDGFVDAPVAGVSPMYQHAEATQGVNTGMGIDMTNDEFL